MIASDEQNSASSKSKDIDQLQSIVILNVHGIGSAGRSLEPGEERTWVSIDQFEMVLDAVVGRPEVRITFDDGNASDLQVGLPRLLARGLTAEFFVLAGLLGQPGRLDEAGVRELLSAGMCIGSHGWVHRDWRRLQGEQAEQEFTCAPRVLSDLAGTPISRVAIPFGSYDRHVLRHLRRSGMTRVYTSDGGRAKQSAWLQPRNSLRSNIGPEWVRDVLDGRPSPKRQARRSLARAVKRVRG